MCSLADDFTDKLTKKPVKKCWGCGKKEVKGEKKFRQCQKCVELKNVPSLFCSDKCYRENWARHHREVHKEKYKLQAANENMEAYGQSMENIDRLINQDHIGLYLRLILEGQKSRMLGDFVDCKKKLRKAQKMYPKLPTAYGELGSAYAVSGQHEAGLTLMEAGIERWAYFCITGQYGDENKYKNVSVKERARQLDIALDGFTSVACDYIDVLFHKVEFRYKKPAWFCNDFILLRVIEVIKDVYKSKIIETKGTEEEGSYAEQYTLRKLNIWQGYILIGAMHNGRWDNDMLSEPLETRTAKHIRQAAECFETADSMKVEDMVKEYHKLSGISYYDYESDAHGELVKLLKEFTPVRESIPPRSSRFFEGSFAIIFGLSSADGERLNKKLGIVKTSPSDEGRLGVLVDGFDEPKSLQERNLMLLPLPERDIALVSCMSIEAQWKYLRPIAESYAARLPDPK